jgi:hypothetical protein
MLEALSPRATCFVPPWHNLEYLSARKYCSARTEKKLDDFLLGDITLCLSVILK